MIVAITIKSMPTLENKQSIQFSKILTVLIVALIIFKITYPLIYRRLTFNRSWPLERASIIRNELEAIKKNSSINIIIGSCGGESSLRADILTKLSGKNWYNFTLRGAQPSFQNKLLQKIKNQEIKIDHVLYVIEPTDLTVQQEQISKRFVTQDFEKRIFSISDVLKENLNLNEKFDEIFTKIIYSDILPWVFTQSIVMEFSQEQLKVIQNFRAFTLDKAFEDSEPWNRTTRGTISFNFPHSNELILKQQDFLLKEHFDDYLKYSEQLEGRISLFPSQPLVEEYLASLESYSKLAGRVTVIIPPELPALYKNDKDRTDKVKYYENRFKENHFVTINAAQLPQMSLKPFLDFDHLSFEASAYFTQQIAELTGEAHK
jgi:hypothetical protein